MPDSSTDAVDLGAWDPEELGATLRQSLGVGSDHEVDDRTRFKHGVATVVRRRQAVPEAQADPREISVFLLSPPMDPISVGAREPMLDSGNTRFAGKLWFVNAPVISGVAQALPAGDPAPLFQSICDDLDLGDKPAVVVDPRGPTTQVRYYPSGLDQPDHCESVRLTARDVRLADVCNIIHRVYKQSFVTPAAQPQGNRLWKDPGRWLPRKDAESAIQAALKHAFIGAFSSCRVYTEVVGTTGRADLHIEELDPLDKSIVDRVAVLELKVLRTFSSTGDRQYSDAEIAEAVEKGVKQAGAYQQERDYRVAVLCCFDMRDADTGDDCFEVVEELAAELAVALRRWYIYSNAELYRNAIANQAAG